MKKIGIFLLMIVSIAAQTAFAQTYWDGTSDKNFSGSGSQADPYLISTAEQLAGLAARTNVDKEDFSGKYIKLTADIYLTDFTDEDTANWKQWEPIAHTRLYLNDDADYGYFRGHFDGNGHTIYNMYYGAGMNWADDWDPNDFDIDLEDYDFSVVNKALFVNLDGGSIENLNMANSKLSAVQQAFLTLNVSEGSSIRNCHVEGEMRATQEAMAGLVRTNGGLIENCSVNIHSDLQGCSAFVLTNESTGVIRNCSTTGAIRCTMGTGSGFVGTNYGLIEKCTSNVYVQALGGPDAAANGSGGHTFRYRSGAGFVYQNEGEIRACGALGNVVGEGQTTNSFWVSAIAGFAYRNWKGVIESCYALGDVRDVSDSTGVGGDPILASFCASNGHVSNHQYDYPESGTIQNCYSAGNIRHHDVETYRNDIHAFVAESFDGESGMDSKEVVPSFQFGYFSNDGLPQITSQSGGSWNGTGVALSYMRSQAFVDTLNMIASVFGLSQWELQDDFPRPTGEYVQNATTLFDGGVGTKENPFQIRTKEQLENFRWLVNQGIDFRGKYILQTADIELNAPRSQWGETAPTQWTPIGTKCSHPYYENSLSMKFLGTYDGGFHEVKNMYISNMLSTQGLFGQIWRGASLRNLGVVDAYVRASEKIGVLAGSASDSTIIIQCWTSGEVSRQSGSEAGMGALFGIMENQALNFSSYVLNCSSSAKLSGGKGLLGDYVGLIQGSEIFYPEDSIVNYLFTGNLNNGGQGGRYNGMGYIENLFEDASLAEITDDGNPYNGARSTEWLQSKEFVNMLNNTVKTWNASHGADFQLNYWQWRENDYPRVATDADWRPEFTITFNSNGGDDVASQLALAGSKITPPTRIEKDDYIFAGWYKDAELKQIFDFDTEIVSDITLYARWIDDERFDYDITPFQNEFATTYHIKTAAQLRGFMAMQNGFYDWGEKIQCDNGRKGYRGGVPTQVIAPFDFSGKKVVLDNDIFLCDTTDWQYWGRGAYGVPWQPIGSYYDISGEGNHTFHGTFDGQGHVIYGMYIELNGMPNRSQLDYNGLFAVVGENATICNVGISASVIDLAEHFTDGKGYNGKKYHFMLFNRCGWASVDYGRPGMLIGICESGATVDQCFAEGIIYTKDGVRTYAGGLIGTAWGGSQIKDSYARVDVNGYGFCGFDSQIGQVCLSNCYSAGKSYYSFSSGYSRTSCLSSFYFDKSLVTENNLSNSTYDVFLSSMVTTNEMHAKSTFVDWDFETIWGRNDAINDGYPYLRVFYEENIPDSPDPVLVTGIELDKTTVNNVAAGSTVQLTATVSPEEAENKEVVWSLKLQGDYTTSAWASIDQNGLLTTNFVSNVAGKTGKAIVTATTVEGNYKATCTVTIYQPKLNALARTHYRRVGESTWTKDNTAMTKDFSINHEYVVVTSIPTYAYELVTWSSSDNDAFDIIPISDSIVTENSVKKTYSRAIFTCKKTGTYTITATHPIGTSTSQSITVADVALTNIYIYGPNKTTLATSMKVGDTQQCVPSFTPAWVSSVPELEWTSSDTDVLTVDENGLITAVGAGTAKITVAAVGTEISYTTSNITVSPVLATSVSIDEYTAGQTIDLLEGATLQLIATILPENTTDKTITWSSGNSDYVTVDENGLVTAVQSGKTKVSAKSSNGKEGYIYVNVKKITLSIDECEQEMSYGESQQLSVTFSPDTVTAPVTWTSANPEYLSVDETGLVTALKCSFANSTSVKVTASLENGSTASKIIYIAKGEQVTEVTLNNSTLTLENGQSATLTATVTPSNATIPTLEWSSSDESVVTVSEDGYISTVGVGTATITVTSVSDDSKYATCDITVISATFYTITFVNADGTELQSGKVREGTLPVYEGETPTQESVQYEYTFVGWSPEITTVSGITTYTAVYSEKIRSYTVRFLNSDNLELQSDVLDYGQMPSYRGDESELSYKTEQYVYTFAGWTPEITTVTGDIDYTPIINSEIRKYAVLFYDWDETLLKRDSVAYNEAATAPELQEREGYTFTGWDNTFTNVVSDMTITAQYLKNVTYYTVIYQDWDGTPLGEEQVEEGGSATGEPAITPSREGYTFTGWDKSLTNIMEATAFTAQYVQNVIYYTVSYQDWDGTPLGEEQVEEGGSATGEPAITPSREGYTFTGWDKSLTNIMEATAFTAQYVQNVIYYTVSYQDWDGTPLGEEQVEEGGSATGEPTTIPSRNGYTFSGWQSSSARTLVADCEKGNTTTLGGSWFKYMGKGTASYSMVSDGANATTHSAKFEFSGVEDYAGMGCSLNKNDKAVDLSGSTGFTFYHKGDEVIVEIGTERVTDYSYHIYRVPSHDDWTPVTVNWTDISGPGWGLGDRLNFNKEKLYTGLIKFQWKGTTASGTFWIDEVSINGIDLSGTSSPLANIKENTTLTAQYTKNVVYYTVTYRDWDGSDLGTEQVKEGENARGLSPNPSRDGYTFTGWSKSIKNITADLIVVAQYQQNVGIPSLDNVDELQKPLKVFKDGKIYILLPNGRKISVKGTEIKE